MSYPQNPSPASAAEIDRYKQEAAEYAAGLVQSNMVVGLGSGSTAAYATRRIALLLSERALNDVVGVATSTATAALAAQLGIPLLDDDDARPIDITIDGSDEVSPDLHLIKGGGGALLREKIVAQSSRREVIVVDYSKWSARLGTRQALPVEVVPFGWPRHAEYLRGLGALPTLREKADGSRFVTDQGNLILDCRFGPIADPIGLAARLATRAGIVEHGLFIGLTSEVITAGPDGVQHVRKPPVHS
jgi:ribose 5-phosphate isomerase A